MILAEGVPLVWLERQIARCERITMIGMHAWSRMAENKSSFTLHTLPTPGFILPACQIHIQACHGIHAAVKARRRAPRPQEAPVASREATTLPAHLTCLPGRAAWGVRSSAPHVQDALLVAVVAPSDLELASWSPLVRTVYYCAVGTRATFLPSERSSRDSSPESTHDFT